MKSKGGFHGLPASDRTAEMRVVDVYRRDGEKLSENWIFIDLLHFLSCLGVDLSRETDAATSKGNLPPHCIRIQSLQNDRSAHWAETNHPPAGRIASMASVSLKNVSKRWGRFAGVNAIDLEIADQEFLVLLGPSGCGKTTTMRMIAGLEDPTAGEIRIGARVVNDLEPKDRDVAMVFQSYGLYPNMTVYENIRFPLKVREGGAGEARRPGAPRRGHGRARRRCSTAARASCRAASASAWRWPARSCGSRTVFLMDEPLSNLDAKLRVSTRAQIKNLQHELKSRRSTSPTTRSRR